ncbi:MAG: PLD nuclease N-terminal domain-containing protein [Pseudomonadota bacterium]
MGIGKGILGLIILAANVWAILNIVQARISTAIKVLWIVLVLAFPVVGFILWLFLGPRSERR